MLFEPVLKTFELTIACNLRLELPPLPSKQKIHKHLVLVVRATKIRMTQRHVFLEGRKNKAFSSTWIGTLIAHFGKLPFY